MRRALRNGVVWRKAFLILLETDMQELKQVSLVLRSGCPLSRVGLASLIVLLVVSVAPVVAAQDGGSSGGVDWTISAGASLVPDYEGSDDYEPFPTLGVRAAWGDGYLVQLGPSTLRALQLRANIVPGGRFQAGPLLNFRPERDDVDNDRVDDLDDVDNAFELGGFLGYIHRLQGPRGATVGANFQFAADVSSAHEGWLFQPGIDFATPLGESFRFNLRGFSTFATEDYMSTYFGIDAKNAAFSGLDRFDADAGFKDVGLGVGLTYLITESWRLGVQGAYTRLIGDAEDSPVTDDEGSANQFFGGVSVSFGF